MSVNLQKAVKDNATDMATFLKDLQEWTTDMKAQEIAKTIPLEEAQQAILEDAGGRPSASAQTGKSKTTKSKSKSAAANGAESVPLQGPPKKKSTVPWDYAAWEKYDAERECRELEAKKKDSELTQEQLVKRKAMLLRLKTVANEKKDLGNNCMKDKNYERAIDFYTEGIKLDPSNAVLFANRAQAYLYVEQHKKAHEDCDKALALDSTYVKAVFRRAKAYLGLDKPDQAQADLKLTLSLDPKNSEAVGLLNGLMGKKKRPAVVKKPQPVTSPYTGPASILESQEKPQATPSSSSSSAAGSSILAPKPGAKTYAFDSELRVRSVTYFNKGQGQEQGGGDTKSKSLPDRGTAESPTFPRYVLPIKKPEALRSKVPLTEIPVQIIGESGAAVESKPKLSKSAKSSSPKSSSGLG